ncbi:succinate--CoA ligase subunit alpha [Rugosimonospora acidiphila]|uniref:Succinate--CoA ligase subunit alpha n=1 Tax=Rugosimonospora acidiphila TaxID=556531 RepID=A0ABP9S1I1_9ACTN
MKPLREWLEGRPGVVVHGLASRTGRNQLAALRAQGTRVVAGVSGRQAGTELDGIPLFASTGDACRATGATVALLFVPAEHVRPAALEALEAGVELLVIPAEGVPVMDALVVAEAAGDTLVVGPNSPGLIVPGLIKLGFMPSGRLRPGPVGLVSRSGTLSYEVSLHLAERGIGISTWIGVGGDVAPFLPMREAAELVAADPQTELLVIVGEVGGTGEESVAQSIVDGQLTVPVHAMIVGGRVVGDEPVGHAGAVMLGGAGGYEGKVARLRAAGATVHSTPWELADDIAARLAATPTTIGEQ